MSFEWQGREVAGIAKMETMQRVKEGAESGTRPLRVLDLGTIGYEECWELQRRTAAGVAAGALPDTLLLLEHPHTYTCGRRGGRDHILISQEQLRQEGIAVLDVDRGGDVTYHGPGQLVAYPILRLAPDGAAIDYPGYVRTLEHVLINTLREFGVMGYAVEGYSGVWVRRGGQEEKVAAIGVKVDARNVSTHGIALNVSTDLGYFAKIVPCGISDRGVASLAMLMSNPPSMQAVKSVFARCLEEVVSG